MTDIHDIKNLLYFLPYLREDTWYMIGIVTAVYCVYIAYLVAFQKYYEARDENPAPDRESCQDSLVSAISGLQTEDTRFFEKLSFIIRSYLEDSRKVPFATKKTSRDIPWTLLSRELREILDICTHYEYAPETAQEAQKAEVLQRIRHII